MSTEQMSTERILLVALLKACSEQSTFMIGEFKMEFKADFNMLFRRVDEFVGGIEKNLNHDQKEYLQSVTDIYHNINIECRKTLNAKYETLKEQEVVNG